MQTTKTAQTPAYPPIKIMKSVFIIRPTLPKEQPSPDKNATLGAQIKPIINEFIEVKVNFIAFRFPKIFKNGHNLFGPANLDILSRKQSKINTTLPYRRVVSNRNSHGFVEIFRKKEFLGLLGNLNTFMWTEQIF